MNPLSIKNQRKVLKILVNLCNAEETGCIEQPCDFESNFPFLDTASLSQILDILESKNLISMLCADYPDNFDIAKLCVTPQGLNYAPQASYDNRRKWLERLWGFLTGSIFTAVIEYLLLR